MALISTTPAGMRPGWGTILSNIILTSDLLNYPVVLEPMWTLLSRCRCMWQCRSYDTQSLHTLTDEQMGVLVSIALEEFGLGLTHTQFNEVMLALFEHIPGFETLPHRRSVQYLKLLWFKYQQAALASQHRH